MDNTARLNELIAAHWNAYHALQAAKEAEKTARHALADFLCKDEEGYKNKTMPLGGGYKLKQTVERSVRVDKKHIEYTTLPQLLTTEQLNDFVKVKQETSFSMTGYNSLPNEVKAKLANFVSVASSVKIEYELKSDNR